LSDGTGYGTVKLYIKPDLLLVFICYYYTVAVTIL